MFECEKINETIKTCLNAMMFAWNKLFKWDVSQMEAMLFISIANRKKIYVDFQHKVFPCMLKTQNVLISPEN